MEESYTGFKDLFTSNSIISSERASKYLSAAAFRARIFERQSRNMPGMQMINAVSYLIFCGSEAVYVLTVLAHEVNVITPAILEKCTDLVHEILLPVSPS